jgi:two-component system, OmpR family, osmolarity sensor histidine kinase EnvZ
MSKLEAASRSRPRTLYARLFALQIAVLVGIVAFVIVLFAADQAERSMENVSDIWAPALREIAHTQRSRDAAREETIVVTRDVDLVHGSPPANAVTPTFAQMRWRALKETLSDRGIPVHDLRVSGTSGDTIVWLNLAESPPRWIGVRSNLDGEDFRWRWWLTVALSVALIALANWWFVRKLVAPLQSLENAVADFSAGKPFVAPAQSGTREVQTLIEAFSRMAKERGELDAQRALMLAGISHDIRSPLGRIRMAAELIDRSDNNAALSERIARNVAIADDLVESFSDYVRAESEPLDDHIDVNKLVRNEVEARGLASHLLVRNEPVVVRGNERLLQRALANVLDNALKHGRAPITVAIENDAQGTRIVVSDSGDGIAEKDRERLLRPFERGDASRSTHGSGLGLAIAARVLARHGGDLTIDRAESGGVRCTLRLPLNLLRST